MPRVARKKPARPAKSRPAEAPEGDARESNAPRSFWSGTLSFGLVTIPVELYAATRSQRRGLRMLAPDGTPLSRRYFSAEGKPLENVDLERGYALDGDTYVVLADEELERLLPDQSRDIDLSRFVPEDSIAPLYFDRAYVLAPARGSSSAYRLLASTMERMQRVGIATFVMRDRQYVVAIRAKGGVLRAETLRFSDELRSPEDIGIPSNEPKSAALEAARSAIKKLSKPQVAAGELKDDYWRRLEKLVQRKKAQHKDVVAMPDHATPEESGAEVIDLMALLQKSLTEQKRSAGDARPNLKKTKAHAKPGTRRKAS